MKRFVCCALAIIVFFAIMPCALAHDKEEHDALLEEILFGLDKPISAMSFESKQAARALEYASYLTLDQFNGNGQIELDFLRSTYGVPGLPNSIQEVDFPGNQFHRIFTHRGWNHTYSNDKANWSTRKMILLATTEKVFDFDFFSGNVLWFDFGYSQKCDSLAAIIYYIHVLGDHEARKDYRDNDIVQLAQPHPSRDNPDVYSEIRCHCEVLFSAQKGSRRYMAFMGELDDQAEKARLLAGTTGGINTQEKFEAYKEQVNDLIELLKNDLWQMLRAEDFFRKVFP